MGTFYEGQSIYGRPRKPGSKSSAPYQPGTFTRGAKKKLCYNCGEPGHYIRDCKKPQNIALTVANMANKKGSNAKAILYELSCQSQEAIFSNQQEEAFATMFEEHHVEGENAVVDDESDDVSGGNSSDEEEGEEDVYFDAVSPEDL